MALNMVVLNTYPFAEGALFRDEGRPNQSRSEISRKVSADSAEETSKMLEDPQEVAPSVEPGSNDSPFLRCGKCHYQTKIQSLLHAHTAKHLLDSDFRCPNCDFHEPNSSLFVDHLATHHGNTLKCHVCHKKMAQSNLKRHILVHTDVSLYDCSMCEFSTNYVGSIKKHTEAFHNRKYKCSHCTVVMTKHEIQLHTKSAHNLDHCASQSAAKSAESVSEPEDHIKNSALTSEMMNTGKRCSTHQISVESNCRFCIENDPSHSKTPTRISPPNPKNEQHSSTDAHPISGKDAPKTPTPTKTNLGTTKNDTKSSPTSDQSLSKVPYSCLSCSFSSNYKGNLNRHTEAFHSRKYRCTECVQVMTKHDLQLHMETSHGSNSKSDASVEISRQDVHTRKNTPKCFPEFHNNPSGCSQIVPLGIKPPKHVDDGTNIATQNTKAIKWYGHCSKCPYKTKNRKLLKRHTTKHLIDNAFVCPKCRIKEMDNVMFSAHLRSHNAQSKIIKCCFCKFQASSPHSLSRHIVKHRPVQLLDCPKCEYTAGGGRPDNLQSHIMNFHSKKYRCSICDREMTKFKFERHIKECSQKQDGKIDNDIAVPTSELNVQRTKPDSQKCEFCSRTYSKNNIKQHVRRCAIRSVPEIKEKTTKNSPHKPVAPVEVSNDSSLKTNYLKMGQSAESHGANMKSISSGFNLLNPDSYSLRKCHVVVKRVNLDKPIVSFGRKFTINDKSQFLVQNADLRPGNGGKIIKPLAISPHSKDTEQRTGPVYEQNHREDEPAETTNVMGPAVPAPALSCAQGAETIKFLPAENFVSTRPDPCHPQKCPSPTHIQIKPKKSLVKSVKPYFSCYKCCFKTRIKSLLKKHVTKHLIDGRFTCTKCDFKEFCSWKFARHWFSHDKGSDLMLKCCFCAAEYKRLSCLKGSLPRHLEEHRVVYLFDCSKCDYSCSDKYKLKAHVQRHHVRRFHCKFCGNFMTLKHIKKHVAACQQACTRLEKPEGQLDVNFNGSIQTNSEQCVANHGHAAVFPEAAETASRSEQINGGFAGDLSESPLVRWNPGSKDSIQSNPKPETNFSVHVDSASETSVVGTKDASETLNVSLFHPEKPIITLSSDSEDSYGSNCLDSELVSNHSAPALNFMNVIQDRCLKKLFQLPSIDGVLPVCQSKNSEHPITSEHSYSRFSDRSEHFLEFPHGNQSNVQNTSALLGGNAGNQTYAENSNNELHSGVPYLVLTPGNGSNHTYLSECRGNFSCQL